MQINKDNIKLQPTSGFDDVGHVFWWNNEIYRGIKPEHADFYRSLFNIDSTSNLVEHGLIPTEITPHLLEDYSLVLKHKKIPIVSYVNEWCFSMLTDAALMTCDLQLELLKSDKTLKDAHPWNTLFEGCKPWFVDTGSIVEYKKTEANHFIHDFRTTYLTALLFKLAGLDKIQKAIMTTYLGLKIPELYRLLFMILPLKCWWRIFRLHRRINKVSKTSSAEAVSLLRRQVTEIYKASEFSDSALYLTRDSKYSHEDKSQWTRRMREVNNIYCNYMPVSVLDVGAYDDGFYSRLAESKGARVVSISTNELLLNKIYNQAKKDNQNITPLNMDFTWPTLNYGPWGYLSAAKDRLKAEFVFLLGSVHHLVQEKLRTFDEIAKYSSEFSEKWALIEFIGSDDPEVEGWNRLQHNNYNLDEFKKSLNKYFTNAAIQAQTGEFRWLILCNK